MHIVTRKYLIEAIQECPDAGNEIKPWVAIAKEVRWHNFPELRGTFKDADNVKGYVIFNIRQNRYRLVTVIHCAKTTKQRMRKNGQRSALAETSGEDSVGLARITAALLEESTQLARGEKGDTP